MTDEQPPCDSDLRLHGQLRESVLFPIIYKPDDVSVCVECARITSSSIDILLKETIILPEKYDEKWLMRLDQDNFVLEIDYKFDSENGIAHGFVAYHISLSTNKVTRYDLPKISGHTNFGMVNGRLGMTLFNHLGNDQPYRSVYTSVGHDSDVDFSDVESYSFEAFDESDDESDRGFTTLGIFSEEKDFEVLCFFDLPESDSCWISGDKIIQSDYDKKSRKVYCVRRLINLLNDMDEEGPSLTKEINGVTVTKPYVQIG